VNAAGVGFVSAPQPADRPLLRRAPALRAADDDSARLSHLLVVPHRAAGRAGPLNEYGPGDRRGPEAFAAGDYAPASTSRGRWSLWGRVTQDVRTVHPGAGNLGPPGKADAKSIPAASDVPQRHPSWGGGFRVSGRRHRREKPNIVAAPQPCSTRPPATAATLFVNNGDAALSASATPARGSRSDADQLPSGNQWFLIKGIRHQSSRANAWGYYDAPDPAENCS